MNGIVVCPQPVAAEAAAEVLRNGGNAVDALVAGALVQGVADPLMCGLGGYGIMLVHEAGGDRDHVLDFFSRAPGGVEEGNAGKLLREFDYDYGFILEGDDNEVGYASIAIPGEVAGLSRALERFGTRSWAATLEPAIALADRGVPVTPSLRGYMAEPASSDKPSTLDRICTTEASRALFSRDGEVFAVGDRLDRTDLAATLRRLAKAGPRDFYEGSIAEEMVADLAANGSLIDAADLAGFAVVEADATRAPYRDVSLSVARFPSGGPTVVEALNLLELQGPVESDWLSAESVLPMSRALRLAIEDKYRFLAGERVGEFNDDILLDRAHAAALLASTPDPVRDVRDDESRDTTHIAVIDRWGNAAALTHTLASGSGVVTPGLGFMYNNFMHGFDPRPGKWNSVRPHGTRPASMCPTMLYRDDDLVAVVGAAGSTRIVSSIVQVVSHLVDRGWDPAAAVMAPRLNCQRNGLIQLEGRFPESVVTGVNDQGWTSRRSLHNYDSYFGRVMLLAQTANGGWAGAGDPRGDSGTALLA